VSRILSSDRLEEAKTKLVETDSFFSTSEIVFQTERLNLHSADLILPFNVESKTQPPASKPGKEVTLCLLYWEQAATPDML
jgi:hypothetical protein